MVCFLSHGHWVRKVSKTVSRRIKASAGLFALAGIGLLGILMVFATGFVISC